MKLDGVQPSGRILHGGHGAIWCVRRGAKAQRQGRDPVRVAHPAGGAWRDVRKQGAVRRKGQVGAAIFRGVGGLDPAAQPIGHELGAIADAQNRHTQIEELSGTGGGVRGIDAAGAAGEDDALGLPGANELQGRGVGQNLAIHTAGPDAAGDKLLILAAEVQDENGFRFHSRPPIPR